MNIFPFSRDFFSGPTLRLTAGRSTPLCSIKRAFPALFLSIAGILTLTLSACAPRVVQPIAPPGTASAWEAYEHYATARENNRAPYRINASLRYGKEGDTRRVVTLLWANDMPPIRLDVMAGLGPLVARIRETDDELVVYAPSENKALVHKGSQRVVLKFGEPVPFTLRDFSALMRGRFRDVFGHGQGITPLPTANGNTVYTLEDSPLPGMLELRPDGLPVRWQQKRGWTMHVAYDDANPSLPYKIKLTHPDGYTALLLVKDRQNPEKRFTERQLMLELPEGVIIEAVKKGK